MMIISRLSIITKCEVNRCSKATEERVKKVKIEKRILLEGAVLFFPSLTAHLFFLLTNLPTFSRSVSQSGRI